VLGAGTDGADPARLITVWEERNGRGIERAAQLMSELRAATPVDAAMLSVALRELRNLA